MKKITGFSLILFLVMWLMPLDVAADNTGGDVNNDGEVNIADVNTVIDYILGDRSRLSIDVNGDGEVNIADVNAIIAIILKDTSASEEHEYVDLGLPSGTLWATCNVGADTPEDYGDYFAWGETIPKGNYTWNSYKWGQTSPDGYWVLLKYNTENQYGVVDNITELELADDAAYTILGASWQIPNWEQTCELVEHCTWTWTSRNGVYGQLGTGPNGNTVFLPAAGNVYGDNFHSPGNQGWRGEYLTSTLMSDDSYRCRYLLISTLGANFNYNCAREFGHSIRAVRISQN